MGMHPRQPENIIQPAYKYFSGCLSRATRQPENAVQSNQRPNGATTARCQKTLAAPAPIIFRLPQITMPIPQRQSKKSKPFRLLPNAFLPDRLAFRLPNKNQRKTKKPPIRGSFVYRLPQSLTHTSTSAQYHQNAYPRKHTSPRAVSASHHAANTSTPAYCAHETTKPLRPPSQNTHPRV